MQYAHKVKSHRPKGSMCINCHWATFDCSGRDFRHMQAIVKDQDGVVIVKCSEFKRREVEKDTGPKIYMPMITISREAFEKMYAN